MSICCRLSVFGMFPVAPCAVCLCVMEAPCMCQSGWFGLELGTGRGWGVGTDAAALSRDCPKPTVLIRITAIISISLTLFLSLSRFLYFPPLTPLHRSFPPSLLSRPRFCSLPLSCCSFSCSCLTPPPRPLQSTQKTTLHSDWSIAMVSTRATSFQSCHWSTLNDKSDFRKSIFNVCAAIYVLLDHVAKVTATVIIITKSLAYRSGRKTGYTSCFSGSSCLLEVFIDCKPKNILTVMSWRVGKIRINIQYFILLSRITAQLNGCMCV